MRYEEDVKKKLKTICLKDKEDVPEYICRNVIATLVNRYKDCKEQDLQKAVELATPLYGSTKFFSDELDATIQGYFGARVEYVYKKLTRNTRSYLQYSINEALAPYTHSAEKFMYDIHYDVDWKQGEFGDRGSCWFTYENVSVFRMMFRHMCYKDEAFAMRFYDNAGNPMARCFGFMHQGYPVLFNAVRGYDNAHPLAVAAGMDAFGTNEVVPFGNLRLGEHDHISGGAYIFGTRESYEYRNFEWSDYERFSNEKLEEERLEYFSIDQCQKCGHNKIKFKDCERCEGAQY